jgi:hypothetical protein
MSGPSNKSAAHFGGCEPASLPSMLPFHPLTRSPVQSSDSVKRSETFRRFCSGVLVARTLLPAIILAAFFLRDLRLLASAGPERIARACWTYSMFSAVYAALLAFAFSFAGIRRPDLISLNRVAYFGLVAFHLLLWGATWALSHSSFRHRGWILALAPSPATLLSQCLLVGLLPDNMANSLGLFSLFLLCVTWTALVIPFAYELSGDPFPGVSRFHPSLVLAGSLNLFSFLYLLEPAWASLDLAAH